MQSIRVVQFGLGPIGLESLRLAASRPGLSIVGAVDIDPAKVGRTLDELTGIPALAGKPVFGSFDELCAAGQLPDVVLHTAGSKALHFFEQMRPVIARGVCVATTCEELIFPSLNTPVEARAFDEICRATGARVVGTGVNPGFVMDLLPIVLSAVAREVNAVHVKRVVDASTRRQPLQAKIGSGREPGEFLRLFKEGRAGHAGFRQSVALIAHAFGWVLDDITETLEPVVATRPVKTRFFEVPAGRTRGLHQIAIGREKGRERIVLDLTMALDEPQPHDTVRLDSKPHLELTLPAGVAGDDATVAALINVVPRLIAASAGLKLLTDLPAATPLRF